MAEAITVKDQEKKRRTFLQNLLSKLRVAPGSLESATLGQANKKIQDAILSQQKRKGQK